VQAANDLDNAFLSRIRERSEGLMALMERGKVEAINMFEAHTTRLVLSGKYRVLLDFDNDRAQIFGAPPLKSIVSMLKERVEKRSALVKALRAAYVDGIKLIKSGKDEDFLGFCVA
jgi:ABC-type nitrate/sulfonate/bicarbonate transport system substrate-binding protein